MQLRTQDPQILDRRQLGGDLTNLMCQKLGFWVNWRDLAGTRTANVPLQGLFLPTGAAGLATQGRVRDARQHRRPSGVARGGSGLPACPPLPIPSGGTGPYLSLPHLWRADATGLVPHVRAQDKRKKTPFSAKYPHLRAPYCGPCKEADVPCRVCGTVPSAGPNDMDFAPEGWREGMEGAVGQAAGHA